jgi:hypothetical protein
MRVDYYHTGNSTEERFALDEAVIEGAWPGPLNHTIDDTNLGPYFFKVVGRKSGKILYSRGFASIFGEWQTTSEAESLNRTFHESLRFPLPAEPFNVIIEKRGADRRFKEISSFAIEPDAATVNRAAVAQAQVWSVFKSGEPRDKVDLLLMGDGYTAREMDKWRRDARRLAELLFSTSPFKERKSDFNVWAIDTPSPESGVSRPSDGVYRRSALRASYDAFGSERYVLTYDNKKMREAAAVAPYEFVEIVLNDRKYGGGGIFNLYATVAADNAFAPYIFVHEFGHHFAGLGDEYYTSDVAYQSSPDHPEPWEPNATADPQARKWSALIQEGTPLPTPWPKDTFEADQRQTQKQRADIRAQKRPEQEMEALFREEQRRETQLLGSSPYAGKVGAFEGAAYEAKGYYRPQVDCIMFSRDDVGFCAVCRRAIERIIDLYTGK